MRLCNYSCNKDKNIVFKSCKGTKKAEPAGFAFFLLKEWNVKVKTEDIFNVDLNTRKYDFEISEIELENVRSFSNFNKKYENSSFSYFYKLVWSRIILSDFVSSSESEVEDGNITKKKDKKFKSIKTLGLVRNFISKNQNAYKLLNCEDSDESSKIKANYRKIVLLLHPDKSSNQTVPDDLKEYEKKFRVSNLTREEKNDMFLLLQDAFTILSDPDMRLEYDSNLPFDEYIPTHEEAKRKNFFALFGPVFQMNSRWSRVKPVPSLGDNESDDNYVEEFYEFWREFETLRTFSHAAPHLLEDAESREEKRWMERENLKVQKKLIKKEQLRIQKLVDLSQQYDPRLKRRQDRLKLEKLEKLKKAQEAKEEEMKRIEIEKERERLEEQLAAEKLKYEKQIAKKLRQQLRYVSQKDDKFAEISRNFDKLATFEYSEIKSFSKEMYNIVKLEFDFERTANNDYIEELKNMDTLLKELSVDSSNLEELYKLFESMSLKLDPNPLNNSNSVYTTTATGTSSTSTTSTTGGNSSSTAGVGHSSTVGSKQVKKDTESLWTTTDLGRLAKAVEINPAGTAGRWNLVAKFVKTKTAAQCIEMARLVANNSDISSYMETNESSTSSTTTSSNKDTNDTKTNNTPDTTNSTTATSEATETNGPTNNVTYTAVDASGWSTEQQTAFENALSKYPSHIDPLVRWRKIASEVPGKTPKECIARFKQIKAAIASRKIA